MSFLILLSILVKSNIAEHRDQYQVRNAFNEIYNEMVGLQCWNMQTMACPRYYEYTNRCHTRSSTPSLNKEYMVETMWPYPSNRNCFFNIRCLERKAEIVYRFERFDFDSGDVFMINGENKDGKGEVDWIRTGNREMEMHYITDTEYESDGLKIIWRCERENDVM